MDNHRYASKLRTAQSTVLGEEQSCDLVRSGISVKLQPEQIKGACLCMETVIYLLWVNIYTD